MAYELKMPQLGLTMEEGTLSKWLKHEGDTVKAGEVVAEITTDKLTNELTSEQDGVMLKLVAQEGDDIPVKGTLAWIGQAGEAVPGAVPAAVAAAVPQAPAAPAAALQAAKSPSSSSAVAPVAMWLPSAPRSWVRRSPLWRSSTWAAPA